MFESSSDSFHTNSCDFVNSITESSEHLYLDPQKCSLVVLSNPTVALSVISCTIPVIPIIIPSIIPRIEITIDTTANPYPFLFVANTTIPSISPINPGIHPAQQQTVTDIIDSISATIANALLLFCTVFIL